MSQQERYDGSFTAKDSKGKTYVIEVYTSVHNLKSFKNQNNTAEGLKTLQTNNGMKVNRIDKGKYKIVQTGEMVSSNEPDIP